MGRVVKILIAITTHQGNRVQTALLRRLWTQRVKGADVVFFYGGPSCEVLHDELRLDCRDDYLGLTDKARAIYWWAYHRGYDYVFDVDDDTYVIPERLLKSGFEQYDYIGRTATATGEPDITGTDYASGGPGVWISRKSLEILVNAPPTNDTADDRWLGQTLRANGVFCHPDRRYCLSREWYEHSTHLISCCSEKQWPVDLQRVHEYCYNRLGWDCHE